jgi:hypothetical protein
MVEFEYRPWKKIIIHELVEYPLDFFIMQASENVSKGGTGRPILWSNGIVLTSYIMQPTEDVVKDQLQGILHWVTLSFGHMEQYQSEFRTKDRIRVPVVNVSNHKIFGPLSKWLKKTIKRKELVK